jgi:hypothetical protein
VSQIKSVQNLPLYLFKIQSNNILSSKRMCSKWYLPFQVFRPQFCMCYLYHACYVTRPPHPPWFDHSNKIRWRVKIIKLLSM